MYCFHCHLVCVVYFCLSIVYLRGQYAYYKTLSFNSFFRRFKGFDNSSFVCRLVVFFRLKFDHELRLSTTLLLSDNPL